MTIDEISDEDMAAGDAMFAKDWRFVLGAPKLDVLPQADRPEIAFAGRSNVGKSSLLNALMNQHGLARTSNTPGRTQELNYFRTSEALLYLVDMIPKMEGCIEVVEAGVEAVVIINGKVPHSVLLELLTDHGAGTLVSARQLKKA